MKKMLLPVFALFILFSSFSFAQESMIRCYTNELLEQELLQNPSLADKLELMEIRAQQFMEDNPDLLSSETVIVIPVVVHIIWNTASQNVPDSRVFSQIRVLNEDFRKLPGTPGWNNHPAGADTRIEFRLADRDPQGNPHSGINRVQTSVTSWNPSTQDAQLKALSYWPSQNYLNVWVANLSGGILGYAYLPGTITPARDGVVILHSAFGHNSPLSPYNLGRTTTHEVGHWINLRHTWGDGGCGVDDGVADTPLCDGQYFSGVPSCPAPTQCGFVRMIQNYMDYSDDGCMNIYTEGQRQRMATAYFTHRTSLLTSFKETIPVSATGVNYNFTDWNNEVYATLNFSSLGSVDSVTVEVFPNYLPPNMPTGTKAVKRYFDIRANGSGFNATLTVHYRDPEVVGFNNGDANLQLYRYDQGISTWIYQGGTVNPTANTVTLANVNQFSIWALSDPADNPVPVELTSFASSVNGNSVSLNWVTASETNNLGFEVQRTLSGANAWAGVGFINSKGTSTEMNSYSFTDKNMEPGVYQYRLKIVDTDGSYEYSQIVSAEILAPAKYYLAQNYPNPFNPSTAISFEIPEKGFVSLKIYNTLGVEVAAIAERVFEAGEHQLVFDASELTSGVYFYTLTSGKFVQTKKMILIR